MKKLLLAGVAITAVTAAGSAGAADVRMPTKAPPMAPTAGLSWNTCYFGGHTGLAAGHTTWKDTQPNGAIDATLTGKTANTDMSGGLYGGQFGCDFQLSGNFVLGLEGSYSGSMLSGTNMDQFNSTWTLRAQTDWIASLTGRVGIAVNSALIYGRGGIAWAHNQFEIENNGFFDGKPSSTRSGWVFGGGVEWGFAPSWSVFLEGDYYNFGGKAVSFVGDAVNPTPTFTVRTTQTIEAVKFGVNYRFAGIALQ